MSQHFEKVQNPSAFIISLCRRNTGDIGFKERRDRQHWGDAKDRSNRQQSWDKSEDHRDRHRSGHFPETSKSYLQFVGRSNNTNVVGTSQG